MGGWASLREASGALWEQLKDSNVLQTEQAQTEQTLLHTLHFGLGLK